VVVNGVDVEDFQPVDPTTVISLRRELDIPENAMIAGSVVRLAPDKGLNYLLEALPDVLIHCPDTYLLLVGDGPLREELATQARALGVQDRVIFAGFHSDPRPYLALLDAFVLPVPVGSMSVGLLEAMAMRCPVIITFGGSGEAVVHEVSGLWAPPRDPRALAEAIVRLLRDPVQARAYGEAAHRTVEESFSAKGLAARLGAIYQTLSDRLPLTEY
jgi:glycosyltransferase involved in cell wall biosynthesis